VLPLTTYKKSMRGGLRTVGLMLAVAACGDESLSPIHEDDGTATQPAPTADEPPPSKPPATPPGAPPGDPAEQPDAGAPPPAPDEPADPWCYSEPIFPEADIDALVDAYGGPGWKDELIGIMQVRHPATAWLLEEQRDDGYFDQFSDAWAWSGMVGWLDTLAHEETHLFNAYRAIETDVHHVLYMRGDLILELPEPALDMQRGEIFDDLGADVVDGIYAVTYLTAEKGERGFVSLLDETSCYLNEVGAVGSVGEHFPHWASVRDGTLAFLYFVQEYLRVAREEHPDVYVALRGEEAYREAVKLLWLRAHFLLPVADAHEHLGVSDGLYRELMHDAARVGELSAFTGVTLSDSPCYEP
jgi:hypothetical protein